MIVLALIVGGALAGLLGVLVAVPLTAAIRISAGHLWRTRVLGQTWAEASSRMIERTPPRNVSPASGDATWPVNRNYLTPPSTVHLTTLSPWRRRAGAAWRRGAPP